MTIIRKREGDKGGCCNPYSELQLEIERVDQTAIDAKTTANNAEATVNANMDKINDAIAIVPQVETNTANISQHENRINTNTTNINKNTIDIQEQDKDITALKAKTNENENRINTNTTNISKNTNDIQKQSEDIVALKTKTNENENRVNTNTTNINKNTNDIQKQSEDIVALKTKTNDNSAAIEALEDEVGPETVAGTIQYRLKNIDTKLPTAIKEVEMIADASTVTHKATHISGTAESDALPVVSRDQAGIMSASVYAAMEDVIANNTSRISVLEQSALTYDISGLVSADPTNAEISAAFQQKYPNIPIQPGIRVADYNNAHFWQYGNNMWILLTQIDVQVATNQSLGVVKGSDTDGKVFVETDGSMSLKGYDALVAKDATHDSKISTLESGLGNANARIDATNTNVANNAQDIISANNEIATNTNDISGLKGRMATAEGQIATHETKINQNTQSINGLTTDIDNLESRMSTAEGQISTNETNINQHTQSINGLTTDVNGLKSRMSTAEGQISTNETNINQHTQNINGLTTDVNGLKTSKQDKLIAGTGISIASDGKTISIEEPQQRIAINTYAQLKNTLNNMAVGDRLTGDLLANSGTSGSVKGLGFFDFEKTDEASLLGNGVTKSIVFKRHRSSVLQGNLPNYSTAQNGGNLGDLFRIDLTSQIVIQGGCAFKVENNQVVFDARLSASNPQITFTESDNLIYINVFWLKY